MQHKEAAKARDQRLLGITKADWQAFRHHPAHKLLQAYLTDYQQALQREAWEYLQQAGSLDNTLLTKIATRAVVAQELAELEFEAIESFYGVEKEEDNVTSTETFQDKYSGIRAGDVDGY